VFPVKRKERAQSGRNHGGVGGRRRLSEDVAKQQANSDENDPHEEQLRKKHPYTTQNVFTSVCMNLILRYSIRAKNKMGILCIFQIGVHVTGEAFGRSFFMWKGQV
jgi:hypothetical protein